MIASLSVATAPNGLMSVSPSVSANSLDAYFYTFTQAQVDARAANPDPTTDAYYTAMIGSLKAHGWTVFEVEAVEHKITSDPQVPLIVCVLALLDMVENGFGHVFTIDRSTILAAANAACNTLKDPPDEIARQLDEWWGSTHVEVGLRVLSVGPILELFGIPYLGAAHFAMRITADSWRDLVSPETDFSFSARPALMMLNWSECRQHEVSLKAKLAAELAGKIKQTQLDLDPAKAGAS
jgi:hypothetical protein